MLRTKLFKDFKFEKFYLKNFINISKSESEMVRVWRNNESVRKWMHNSHIIGKKEHANFIDSLKSSCCKVYWLVKEEDEYLGMMNFSNILWQHRNAYLGIYTNPEKKIKGAGSKIMSLIIHMAFRVFGFHSLRLEVVKRNVAAINLYNKFGFEKEGELKEFFRISNGWENIIVMSLINNNEGESL